jgi:hypothetical protein
MRVDDPSPLSNTPGQPLPGYKKPVKVRRTFEEAAQEALKRERAAKGGNNATEQQQQQPISLTGRVNILSAVGEDFFQSHNLNFNPAVAASFAAASTTPSTPTPSDPAAALPATPLTLASEVVWLYRTTLRHVRVLDSAERRKEAAQEARTTFRALREAVVQASAAAAAPPADASQGTAAAAAASSAPVIPADAPVRASLARAYSKLSFLRMATPKLRQPRLAFVPAYEGAIKLFGSSGGGPAVYAGDGRTLTPEERARAHLDSSTVGGRTVVNSQGITDEQVRRHQGLVDRMHFRGPRWAGKPKF